jgi:NADPH-dependent F420 reductase
MRIAVIGAGHVGSALGAGWVRAGHQVVFGVRELKLEEGRQIIAETQGRASVALMMEATRQAQVVVLAVPWSAVEGVLAELAPVLSGKILIDCTNPVSEFPALDHKNGSGGQQVARLAPTVKVVMAFNTTGFENMRDPGYSEGAATMFYAGDDPAGKKIAHQLAQDLGFDAVDAGSLAQSHALEVIASFWGNLAYGQKMGRGIALRLMHRK